MEIGLVEKWHLDGIMEIFNDAIINTTAIYHYEPWNKEKILDWYEKKREQALPILVATDNKKVVGFASYGSFRVWPAYQFTVEHSVYVSASCRGQGIGKKLLEEIINKARAEKYHVMVAGIDATNAISSNLHMKFGFKEVGHLKEVGYKFDRWLDLKFFQLNLN